MSKAETQRFGISALVFLLIYFFHKKFGGNKIITYLCKKIAAMPTIFVLFGYRFLFYANDHTPIHVHVVKDGNKAKYNISCRVGGKLWLQKAGTEADRGRHRGKRGNDSVALEYVF